MHAGASQHSLLQEPLHMCEQAHSSCNNSEHCGTFAGRSVRDSDAFIRRTAWQTTYCAHRVACCRLHFSLVRWTVGDAVETWPEGWPCHVTCPVTRKWQRIPPESVWTAATIGIDPKDPDNKDVPTKGHQVLIGFGLLCPAGRSYQ